VYLMKKEKRLGKEYKFRGSTLSYQERKAERWKLIEILFYVDL